MDYQRRSEDEAVDPGKPHPAMMQGFLLRWCARGRAPDPIADTGSCRLLAAASERSPADPDALADGAGLISSSRYCPTEVFVLFVGVALLIAAEALILFTKNAPPEDQFANGIRRIFKYVVRPVALVLIPVGVVVAVVR